MSDIDWDWIVQNAPEWWVPIFRRVMAFGGSLQVDQDEEALADAVRNFAQTIPPTLTRQEQDDFCGIFYESLHATHHRRFRLMLFFRNNLPPTLDPLSYHEVSTLVRDFARSTIANLTDLDRIQTEIANLYTSLTVPQQLKDVLIVEFKWSIDNMRPDFPLIMALFQGYMMEHPLHRHPHPRDRLRHFTHHLTPQMWQRIYELRPFLAPQLPPVFPLQPAFELTWEEDIPPWFDPVLPSTPTWPQREVHYTPEIEGSRTLQEICDYAYDLVDLQIALNEVCGRMLDIVFDFLLEEPNNLAGQYAHRLLQESLDDLKEIFLLEGVELGNLTLDHVPAFRERLAKQEEIFDQVRARTVQAEQFLVDKEASLLAEGEFFLCAASRFERSKYRQFFKSAVDGLKTERLKHVEYTEDVLHSWGTGGQPPVVRPFAQDDTICPICHEDFTVEEGEIVPQPVVTLCCHRPFHISCMLTWLFQKMEQQDDMTCPMCRTEVYYDFLGEVLELEVRRMAYL